ncbi:MAG: hypothetical protein ABJ242_00745 [Marinomonas sp.]
MERNFSPEELISLCVAIVLHGALALVLIFQPSFKDKKEIVKPQERITVSLASEVGLTATSPDPAEISRASRAPTIAPNPSPGVAELDTPDIVPEPAPQDSADSPPPPKPKDTTPRRRPDNTSSKAPPKPKPKAKPKPKPKPKPKGTPKSKPKPKPKGSGGGSQIGDDFLGGAGTSNEGSAKSAAPFGRAERSALNRAITRALRPHWSAPTGLDADKLVTPVSWQLNKDGSLKGTPRCKQAKGVTPGNRSQVKRHCDAARRAVRLAAPFKLPPQFYSRWDDLEWDFDRKL